MKRRRRGCGCGCLVLLVLGLVLAIPLIIAVLAGSHKDDKTSNCGLPIAAAAAEFGGWRLPLDRTYAVSPSVPPTDLQLIPLDGTGAMSGGPVLAAQNGTITAAKAGAVTIDHGEGVTITYAGLTPAAASSASITQGQKIGDLPKGTPLHLAVTINGTPTDPRAFFEQRGVPLDGRQPTPPAQPGAATAFALPDPGEPRKDSLSAQATPIPADMLGYYKAAGAKYGIPWTLLAGIGREETNHNTATAVSSAGAQGAMQFMPATFAMVGVDGSGDGKADINNPADAVASAANYLVKSGVKNGDQGVRAALGAYNHADWYINDVLFWAKAYGGGLVVSGAPSSPGDCPSGVDADGKPTAFVPGKIGANIMALQAKYQAEWMPYEHRGQGVDPGNWYAGECVSWAGYFVRSTYPKYKDFNNAWHGSRFGNATTWAGAARATGVPVDATPAVGAIAQRMATPTSTAGHVAVVTAVNSDGTIDVAEYNYGPKHQFGTRTHLAIAGHFDNFLHFER